MATAGVKLVTLACNHCGGKLKISKQTKFVTCTYCDTQLAVHMEDGAAYTEVREAIEELAATTAELEEEVGALRAQNRRRDVEAEVARIDREWDEDREPLMMRTKSGARTVPTRASAYAAFVAAPVMVALMIFMGTSFGSRQAKDSGLPTILVLIGIAGGGGMLVVGFHQLSQAKRFDAARRRYEDRRAEALGRLARADEEAPRPRKKKKRRAVAEE